MEINQARILLRKINQIFDAVSDSNDDPSRIEVDLLQDYTRQFYASLWPNQLASGTVARTDRSQNSAAAQPVTVGPVVEEKPTPELVNPSEVEDGTVSEKESNRAPEPAPIEVEEMKAAAPSASALKAPVPEVVHEEVAKSAKQNGSSSEADVLFTMEEATDLSSKLRTSPLDDLSRAMGINERFLTINELFKGDHEAFDQVLRRLNDLPSFSAARTYLENEVIDRYDWLDSKRRKKAAVFIQLIRRRYL
ncbi:MAG: hypothetical protein K9I85_05060 [Saprospiraceae bacterium]|nr:hypothetical protein [Saprospiraceae bacterium]